MHKKLNLRRMMAFRTMNVSLWTIWWLKVSNKNHPIIFRKPLTKCLGGLWEPDLWIWTDKTMKSFPILLDKMSFFYLTRISNWNFKTFVWWRHPRSEKLGFHWYLILGTSVRASFTEIRSRQKSWDSGPEYLVIPADENGSYSYAS